MTKRNQYYLALFFDIGLALVVGYMAEITFHLKTFHKSLSALFVFILIRVGYLTAMTDFIDGKLED